MDGDSKKRVGVIRSSKVDWLSNLPESLLCKILLNLPTKDVVRTSVLSKSWRNLWRNVPRLDADDHYFPDYKTFVSFVDAFLSFNTESYLESFTLSYSGKFSGLFSRWISTVIDRKVKHLNVDDCCSWNTNLPPNLYTCGSLVSLELSGVNLASPKFVSLPCLKFMDLSINHFANVLDFETLISGCPVLESLYIEKCFNDGIKVLRVCSQSLLRFTHDSDGSWGLDDLVVEINAPRLQYLMLSDSRIGTWILSNTSSLVVGNIDTGFNWSFENSFENDLQKRKMIGSFLEGISCVKDMTIGSQSLEVIYLYSKCHQLPLFRNLFFLRVSIPKFRLKMLPIFLESCPNLKSIVVANDSFPLYEAQELGILSGPRCLLSSLEFVDLQRPLRGVAMEMELVSYFLENSANLKKLTVRLDYIIMKTGESAAVINKILAIRRLSSSCQVIVL